MALTKNSQIDLNGNEMILDADGDTTITADTDDQIDIKVGGTDTVVITGGAMALKGATPTLTIGDAGAEDTKIVFDGNAQDFYIGLDDSADDLVIGKGSAVGTTPAISVDENQKVTFTKDIEVQGDSVSGSEGGHITLRAASGGSKEFGIDVDSSNNFRIITEDDGTGDNGAAHVYVTNTGNVGIGDSGPSTKLSVLDSSTVYARIKCSSASNAAVLELHSSDGTGMDFVAYGTSATGTVFGGLHDRVSAGIARNVVDVANRDTIIGTSSHRFIEFVTSDVGRLRVTASGSSYGALHYTSDYGRWDFGALNTGYHHIMAQTGPSKFYFNVRAEASGGFHTYSDENLKKDITTVTGALDSVAKMKGVTFKWKDAANRGGHDTGKQFGVTAQNMLEVDAELPSLDIDPLYNAPDKDGNYFIDGVKEDDKYYTMDYSRLTPFFIEAIKELKTKLEAAEARIATLEGGE